MGKVYSGNIEYDMWNPYKQTSCYEQTSCYKQTGEGWGDIFSKLAPDLIKAVPSVISSIGSLKKNVVPSKSGSDRNNAIKEELKNPNLTAKERTDLIKLLT